ncbi:methionine gamma-lyase family protein [Lachnoclostridium sp. Marseille-P6806]|uniref:methionine gamma-lyase family protein n=1 Tax=Lachnoclostridium sp. Marseille-P6806 TaxID=2364793 RepID=UPI0010304CE9|nr:methionine gamma-lyase family protein [Lachnoclostridium sp. Marseille-P6806]
MSDIYEQYALLGISGRVLDFAAPVLETLRPRFAELDETAEFNQLRVIKAMQDAHVGEANLMGTTGYGYDDIGREGIERTYAGFFGTEDALVRPQITCGTHALALALSANLRPGDELLSASGKPYDTLEEVIGIRPSRGSLAEFGISYRQADLNEDGSISFENIRRGLTEKTRLVEIQRSRGYLTRPTLSIEQIGETIRFIRSIRPDVIIMIDNCYGEFTERREPSQVGADMVVGSLIKNPGGGLAPTGGYIAGTAECVANCAVRLTSPGLGKEVGASLGILPSYYEGFFLAPTMTASAIKGAVFAAACYERLGFDCFPKSADPRYDIVQAVTFGSPEAEIAFCQGIQAAAPVDSFVVPEPDTMPGYDAPVVMAAGAFVSGSTVELSADGPIREPYTAYFQGGLSWPHAKLGVLKSLQYLLDRNLITI